MRKTLLLLLVILASVFVNRNASSQATCTGIWDSCKIQSSPSPNYCCWDYVRAALEKGWVNLQTGVPSHPSTDFGSIGGYEISNDPKYIYVNWSPNYDVVSFEDSGEHHDVLKLRNSKLFAAKFGTRPLYWIKDSTLYQGMHLHHPRFMVYVGNISPATVNNLNPGQQVQLSVIYHDGLTYTWSYNSTYFSLVSGGSSNSITLQANCTGGGGTQTVSVSVSGLSTQVYQATVTLTTLNCPCQGIYQINGSGTVYQLNTVNSISGSPIITTLNGGSGVTYAWTLTSGSPTWYYYGTGNKILYVALNKNSSASFRFTSSTCNRSITFYRGSSLMASKSLNTSSDSINAELDTLFIPYDAVNESVKEAPFDANANNGVFVNQARKILIINDNIEGERVYKIISIQGMLKKTGKIHSGKSEIDIQDLQSGIYIVTIGDCSYRFIKQ